MHNVVVKGMANLAGLHVFLLCKSFHMAFLESLDILFDLNSSRTGAAALIPDTSSNLKAEVG